MQNRLKIDCPIIVEGRYDKIKLDSIVDGLIIAVNGFSLFTDEPLKQTIVNLAKNNKLILLLDSDAAGFKIRGFLHSILPIDQIVDIYIPDVKGVEKRKTSPSKEGKLGVEGIRADTLRNLLFNLNTSVTNNKNEITKQDFIRLGLSGGSDSSAIRKKLYKKLNLPEHISTKNAATVLNRMITINKLEELVEDLRG